MWADRAPTLTHLAYMLSGKIYALNRRLADEVEHGPFLDSLEIFLHIISKNFTRASGGVLCGRPPVRWRFYRFFVIFRAFLDPLKNTKKGLKTPTLTVNFASNHPNFVIA